LSEIDKQWEELEKQKMEEYDRKVQEKIVRANEKRLKNQKEINSQLDEFNVNYIKKMKQE
jgi:hypothetical protein